MYVVYAELVLLDNWLLDFLLLALSCRVLQRRIKLLRCSIGAIIGGLYSCAALAIPWMSHIIIKLFIAAGMTYAAAPDRRLFWKYFAAFLGVGLLAGGAGMALMYTFQIESFGGARYALAGITAALILGHTLGHSYPKIKERYKLAVIFGNEQLEFTAGVDTGNALKDKFGRSVIVVDKADFLSQLSEAQRQAINTMHAQLIVNTASGRSGLVCIEPERIVLAGTYECRCCIALAENVNMSGCNALLSTELKHYKIRGK